jgi:PAS domain S-box-containing protein
VVHEDITPNKQEAQRKEADFKAAQEIASLGTWEWEASSGAMRWSDQMYRIFGYTPGACIPNYDILIQALHMEERSKFISAIDKIRINKEPYTIEFQIVRPDGSMRQVQFQGLSRLDMDNSTFQLSGTVFDITERTEKAIELAQAHQTLLANQFAMESVGIGVAWMDLEFSRFIYANRYLSELLGYSVDEMGMLDVHEIFSDIPIESIRKGVKAKRLVNDLIFESTFATRDRRKIPIEIALYYRKGYGDSSPHFIAFISDISSRKETEQALIQAQVSEAASNAKSAFLANMSHEIRTPMNAIVGMAQLIRRSALTPLQITQLNQIDVSAEHLLGVINDILDLSKIEAGKFILDDDDIHIDLVIQRTKTIVEPLIRSKGLNLAVDSGQLSVHLRGDLTRLSQALINYANNAVKFTDQGTISIRTSLVEETESTQLLRFEVSDTGIGIAPEKLTRLFNAFEQADNSSCREYGGTGLGLAITKRFAELMGGEAGASSTVGLGSTFWFTVRLTKSTDQNGSTLALTTTEEDAAAILLRDFQGRRILLSEDDPVNQMVISMGLDDTGLMIEVAEDGAQALEMARREAYDLILMDMQMPRMDGIAATQALRTIPEYKDVPIIALTANAFVEDRRTCLDVGMNDFLTKPVYREVLCGTILKWLRQRNFHE